MHRATLFLLLPLLSASALAQERARPPALQGPWTYQIQGRLAGRPLRGQVTLDREGERGVRLESRLEGAGLPRPFAASGTAAPMGWRFAIPVQGVTDRLQGRAPDARPSEVRIRRLSGDRVQGFITEHGRVRGSFTGRRVNDPLRPCRPTRDAWWARHAVGTWEVGRAMFDLFRPGGGYEGLRGGATLAHTNALRAALVGPGPFNPDQIYAAARARTGSAAQALELSFALIQDHTDLPLAPLPGIPPEAPRWDKYNHYFASAILARRSNATGSFWVGMIKEVLDEASAAVGMDDHGWDDHDIMADALGAEFGQSLQCE